MKLYLVRHGQSEGNLKETHQGENVPLSEEGIKQAKLLAKRLKDKKISTIYASPFLRAQNTAETIASELEIPIVYMDELKEKRRPSEIEGLSYDHPKAVEVYEATRKNQIIPEWKYSDDESYNDLLKRAKELEQHLINDHVDDTVLCVTHVGILIMIAFSMLMQDKLTPEVFWQFYYHARYNNTGITILEYIEKDGWNKGWNLVTWNDVTHL
jgi:broad specificity phosphatase PhoE